MLDYDEWFEKHGFELEDENSFQAYEDYVSEYQNTKYHEGKDERCK